MSEDFAATDALSQRLLDALNKKGKDTFSIADLLVEARDETSASDSSIKKALWMLILDHKLQLTKTRHIALVENVENNERAVANS